MKLFATSGCLLLVLLLGVAQAQQVREIWQHAENCVGAKSQRKPDREG